jgi:tetratricopeptide (TPR) repeat protein
VADSVSISTRARALYDQRHYAELVELLAPIRAELIETAPYAAFYLADAWRRLGQQPAALELVSSFAGSSKRSGIPRLELDRLNLEGMLRFETGDIPGAESSWRELLARASVEASDDFTARANNNLGIIYTLQARTPEAVMSYQRAVTAYKSFGSMRGLAQSHQNLAITYRTLELFDESDDHFDEAIRCARAGDNEDEIARAEQERALLIYLRARDGALARVTAKRAMGRFSSLSDPVGVSDSVRVLAMIDLGEGDTLSAQKHGEGALETARASGHSLLEAELLEVLAGVARKRADSTVAGELENQATELFARLHAPAWGTHFRETVERLTTT